MEVSAFKKSFFLGSLEDLNHKCLKNSPTNNHDKLKILRNICKWATTLAQITGNFPFVFNESHELQFKWSSWPFLTYSMTGSFVLSFSITYASIPSINPTQNMPNTSMTEKLSWSLIFGTISATIVIVRTWTLINRHKIIRFYSELSSIWSQILESYSECEYHNANPKVTNFAKDINKSVWYLWTVVGISAFLVVGTTGSMLSYMIFSDAVPHEPLLLWIGMCAWMFNSIFYSSLMYWIAMIIRSIGIAFKCNSTKLKMAHEWKTIAGSLHEFSLNEELVNSLNSVFSVPLIVTILATIFSWIVHSFVAVTGNMRDGFAWSSVMLLFMTNLDFMNLFCICDASDYLSEQVY